MLRNAKIIDLFLHYTIKYYLFSKLHLEAFQYFYRNRYSRETSLIERSFVDIGNSIYLMPIIAFSCAMNIILNHVFLYYLFSQVYIM